MTELIKIIGRYKPEGEPTYLELELILRGLGYYYASRKDFRNPAYNTGNKTSSTINKWHTDPPSVDPGEELPEFHGLWANRTPTEILKPDGSIYKCKCWDIVIYNNRLCKHRMPKYLSKNRYFARFWDIKKGG